MNNKFVEFMQPVFHIGDVIAGHIEDKTNWNVEKVSLNLLIIGQIVFCATALYRFSPLNVFLCLVTSCFVKQDYDNKLLYSGNKAYKEGIRNGFLAISMFIGVLGYIFIAIDCFYENSYSGFFILLSCTFSILSDLLYFANPLPPVKKYQLQFT